MKSILILLVFSLTVSCGKKDEPCQQKAEIDTLAISSQSYRTFATINVTATGKDNCPGSEYKAIYTLKEGSEPKDCTDGDSKISGASVEWTDVKNETLYYIRACLTTTGYTSPGVAKSVTTP